MCPWFSRPEASGSGLEVPQNPLKRVGFLFLNHSKNKIISPKKGATSSFFHNISIYSILYNFLNSNFCPPTDASYISPPFCMVKTIIPSAYSISLEIPSVTATAETCAENSNLLSLNRSKSFFFSPHDKPVHLLEIQL